MMLIRQQNVYLKVRLGKSQISGSLLSNETYALANCVITLRDKELKDYSYFLLNSHQSFSLVNVEITSVELYLICWALDKISFMYVNVQVFNTCSDEIQQLVTSSVMVWTQNARIKRYENSFVA